MRPGLQTLFYFAFCSLYQQSLEELYNIINFCQVKVLFDIYPGGTLKTVTLCHYHVQFTVMTFQLFFFLFVTAQLNLNLSWSYTL